MGLTIFLRKICVSAGIAGGAMLLALPVQAEELIFRCSFDWMCDPNRKCIDADEDIRFRIDTDISKVERIGGNPVSKFDLILGDRALTVLETPISGGTTTTTIMINDGSAVHSENVIDGRILSPRQFLGQCIAS